MTKKIEYTCDFCNGTHFDKAPIHGMYWHQKTLDIVDKSKSEHHLCETCLQAIYRAWLSELQRTDKA